ncbi:M24 family metallopeptidase [Candidatus Nomurabacteria bacterium]|nr:M24 family metallopeptidase [Candidatus Nomurabacteria bacterium]
MQTKLIHEVRAVKSKKELENIVKAQRIAERVLGDVLKELKDGVTEIEIANFIKKSFVKYGAPILSFPPIVAFGKNTANIHHEPGETKLKKPIRGGATVIMFDFGCTVNHYCSDMTRTYFWGEPNAKQKKIYLGVLKAMELAMNKVGLGEKRAKIIDETVRNFLGKNFGLKRPTLMAKQTEGFPHGLGHGVGTVIHEWPNFKPKSEDILPVGCVMTIEPGLYFKNFGGIRIEDMILITKNGYKNLTNVSKDVQSAILK